MWWDIGFVIRFSDVYSIEILWIHHIAIPLVLGLCLFLHKIYLKGLIRGQNKWDNLVHDLIYTILLVWVSMLISSMAMVLIGQYQNRNQFRLPEINTKMIMQTFKSFAYV